jgi:hypothetical protein
MRYYLLAICLFLAIAGVSQRDTLLGSRNSLPSLDDSIVQSDSTKLRLELQDMTRQSLGYFPEIERRRKENEREKAGLKLLLAAAFLLVLVVAWNRRRKK